MANFAPEFFLAGAGNVLANERVRFAFVILIVETRVLVSREIRGIIIESGL
jgi:hypothetical protein